MDSRRAEDERNNLPTNDEFLAKERVEEVNGEDARHENQGQESPLPSEASKKGGQSYCRDGTSSNRGRGTKDRMRKPYD